MRPMCSEDCSGQKTCRAGHKAPLAVPPHAMCATASKLAIARQSASNGEAPYTHAMSVAIFNFDDVGRCVATDTGKCRESYMARATITL